jgi:hypothetical protein
LHIELPTFVHRPARKKPIGVFDVEIDASVASLIREEHEGGGRLRSNQEDVRQKHIADAMLNTLNVADAQQVEDRYHCGGQRPSSVNPDGASKGHQPNAVDEQVGDAGSDACVSEESDDLADSLLGSVLQSAANAKAKSKAKSKGNTVSPAKPALAKSRASSANHPPPAHVSPTGGSSGTTHRATPHPSPLVDDGGDRCGRGGKGGRIPLSLEGVLKYDGFYTSFRKFEECARRLEALTCIDFSVSSQKSNFAAINCIRADIDQVSKDIVWHSKSFVNRQIRLYNVAAAVAAVALAVVCVECPFAC